MTTHTTFTIKLAAIASAPILALLIGTNALAVDTDLALEPTLNSEVSANGLYAFERDANSIELEASINGDVSANGRFASQAEQDAYAIERGSKEVSAL